MALKREGDFPKQLTDCGDLNHILRDKNHCPPGCVKSSTNPGGSSPGSPCFLSVLSQSPHSWPCHHTQFDPSTEWQRSPSLWGHSQGRFVDSLAVGIWGHLGIRHLPRPLQQPLDLTSQGPCVLPGLWKEDPSCSAQASHQVCYLGPSTETGWCWVLEVAWPPLPPPLPLSYSIQPKVSGPHPREVWDCCEKCEYY